MFLMGEVPLTTQSATLSFKMEPSTRSGHRPDGVRPFRQKSTGLIACGKWLLMNGIDHASPGAEPAFQPIQEYKWIDGSKHTIHFISYIKSLHNYTIISVNCSSVLFQACIRISVVQGCKVLHCRAFAVKVEGKRLPVFPFSGLLKRL